MITSKGSRIVFGATHSLHQKIYFLHLKFQFIIPTFKFFTFALGAISLSKKLIYFDQIFSHLINLHFLSSLSNDLPEFPMYSCTNKSFPENLIFLIILHNFLILDLCLLMIVSFLSSFPITL